MSLGALPFPFPPPSISLSSVLSLWLCMFIHGLKPQECGSAGQMHMRKCYKLSRQVVSSLNAATTLKAAATLNAANLLNASQHRKSPGRGNLPRGARNMQDLHRLPSHQSRAAALLSITPSATMLHIERQLTSFKFPPLPIHPLYMHVVDIQLSEGQHWQWTPGAAKTARPGECHQRSPAAVNVPSGNEPVISQCQLAALRRFADGECSWQPEKPAAGHSLIIDRRWAFDANRKLPTPLKIDSNTTKNGIRSGARTLKTNRHDAAVRRHHPNPALSNGRMPPLAGGNSDEQLLKYKLRPAHISCVGFQI
ncbi:hypothetical protein C8F04DRAFT_1196663 [Mycena alexandri]|uniref:Uncharacterized protein n=1 Tax=Mycena alexandri TaxID=1745969 RepID=A0AAD6WTJ4_9AGAR|nr:hypothetical protein C8F04DRAFT_1196663 [Mycena alexandri]